MNIKRALLGFAAPLALLTMSGCASNFTAHVSRFQRLPAPQGQTFRVVQVKRDPATAIYDCMCRG